MRRGLAQYVYTTQFAHLHSLRSRAQGRCLLRVRVRRVSGQSSEPWLKTNIMPHRTCSADWCTRPILLLKAWDFIIICRMREILSLMRVSVRFGRNACVTRPMRETWQVCIHSSVASFFSVTCQSREDVERTQPGKHDETESDRKQNGATAQEGQEPRNRQDQAKDQPQTSW